MSPHRKLTYRTVERDGEMGVWHPMELDQSFSASREGWGWCQKEISNNLLFGVAYCSHIDYCLVCGGATASQQQLENRDKLERLRDQQGPHKANGTFQTGTKNVTNLQQTLSPQESNERLVGSSRN